MKLLSGKFPAGLCVDVQIQDASCQQLMLAALSLSHIMPSLIKQAVKLACSKMVEHLLRPGVPEAFVLTLKHVQGDLQT